MIIGLTGKKQSGKSTVASYLEQEHVFLPMAFATPLKTALVVMFGWSERHMEGDLKEVIDPLTGVTPRHAMQTLGTEWGRNLIHPDIWLRLMEHNIKANPNTDIVITDVRFENEATLIRNLGGVIVHVSRESEHVDLHQSEAGIKIDEARDYIVRNDKDIPALYQYVDVILELIKEEQG